MLPNGGAANSGGVPVGVPVLGTQQQQQQQPGQGQVQTGQTQQSQPSQQQQQAGTPGGGSAPAKAPLSYKVSHRGLRSLFFLMFKCSVLRALLQAVEDPLLLLLLLMPLLLSNMLPWLLLLRMRMRLWIRKLLWTLPCSAFEVFLGTQQKNSSRHFSRI
jgi:hypothetical protein